MNLLLPLPQQTDPAVHQETAENIDEPVKTLDQAYARKNEYAARDQRSDDSPEQHPVLQFTGHAKISEDHEEYKKIVNAERELNQIADGEFQACRAPMPEIHQHRESCGQSHPHRAPAQGFAKADRVCAAIEHAQVERQHRQHKDIKENPEEQHS